MVAEGQRGTLISWTEGMLGDSGSLFDQSSLTDQSEKGKLGSGWHLLTTGPILMSFLLSIWCVSFMMTFSDSMGKWPLTPAVDHRVSRTRPEFSMDLFRKGMRGLIENEDYFSQQYYRMFPLSIVSYGSFHRGKGG